MLNLMFTWKQSWSLAERCRQMKSLDDVVKLMHLPLNGNVEHFLLANMPEMAEETLQEGKRKRQGQSLCFGAGVLPSCFRTLPLLLLCLQL